MKNKILNSAFSFFAVVFFSLSAQAAPVQIDIESQVHWWGSNEFNTPGSAGRGNVLGMGDFNCDGIDDVIFSDQMYDNARGRISITFGSSSFEFSSQVHADNMDITIQGDDSGEGLGAFFVMDTNDDDCDDIVISGGKNVNGTPYNTVYVVDGGGVNGGESWAPGDYTISEVVTTRDASRGFHGPNEEFGILHPLGKIEGDFNGDGDLNDEDRFFSNCSAYRNRCYIMSVSRLHDTNVTNFDQLSTALVIGDDPEHSMDSIDIDADGIEDLIVRDESLPDADLVTIYFGPLSSSPSGVMNSQTGLREFSTFSVDGRDLCIEDTNDSVSGFGSYVSAGHVYGSEHGDLIIGNVFGENAGEFAGCMYIISGESLHAMREQYAVNGGLIIQNTTSGPWPFNFAGLDGDKFCGNQDLSKFGMTFSNDFGADLNGDGQPEIMIGSSFYDALGMEDAGGFFIKYGGDLNGQTSFANATTQLIDTTSNDFDRYMVGLNSGDELAYTINADGDVNGDGLDDVLVAMHGFNNDNGLTLLYFGEPTDNDNDGVESAVFNATTGKYERFDCNDSDASITPVTFYGDADGDDFGDINVTTLGCTDDVPAGFVMNSGDCDDTNASINTSASEVCGDGVDNNCDTQVDESCQVTEPEEPVVTMTGYFKARLDDRVVGLPGESATVHLSYINATNSSDFEVEVSMKKVRRPKKNETASAEIDKTSVAFNPAATMAKMMKTNRFDSCQTSTCATLENTEFTLPNTDGAVASTSFQVTIPRGYTNGKYDLHITVKDKVTGQVVETVKPESVFTPGAIHKHLRDEFYRDGADPFLKIKKNQ
jgi:hypothetical protein